MRNWEIIEKRTFGKIYGSEAWSTTPAVRVTKAGLTLNPKFVESFAKDSMACQLLYLNSVKEGRFLGIKIIPRGEESANDFKISGKQETKGLKYINFPHRLKEKVQDLHGEEFVARTNSTETIVEINLTKEGLLNP